MNKLMGRNEAILSRKEAARLLGVSVRNVSEMVCEGRLKSVPGTHGSRLFLYADDVHALAEVRRTNTSPKELHKYLLDELAHSAALERRVCRIERVLCLHTPVLGYEEADVLDLVEKVHAALEDVPSEVPDILEWCAIFRSVHEEYFQLIQRYTGNPDPWDQLLLLAEKMYEKSAILSVYDQEAEDAHVELSSARLTLRHAAFFYVVHSRGHAHAGKVVPEGATGVLHRVNKYIHR